MQVDLRRLQADQQELRGSLTMNGYNFTERVRKVLAMAREESARLHHEYVGTEHILLGLIREGEGVAATIIENLGVKLEALADTIESIVKRGRSDSTTGPDLPYTSRAKKVLELAMSEAREANHSYVGTEHLLLGLVREEKGIAAQVLVDSGITLDTARAEMTSVLGEERPTTVRVASAAAPQRSVWTATGEPSTQMPERVRAVLRYGQNVATELGSADFLPIHVAIALLRHGDGFANAVLDRLHCDRAALLGVLENDAKRDARPPAPEQDATAGPEMIAWQRSIEGGHWRLSSTTLHVLLALLDSRPEIATAFEVQGINASRVRAEAMRMSG
jgi:ATP-dependent Clp protease ATP-binding subunit ClpA